jgi:acyl transferase domain-containing protein
LPQMASSHGNKQDNEPIAIVGYAYRAPSIGRKQLWEFLAEAKSAFSSVPPDRFQHDAFYHPDSEKAGCLSSKGGHFLPEDIYAFDAPFFNITAEEAKSMDPQHRLLLECAFEASESAGWPLAQLAGSR